MLWFVVSFASCLLVCCGCWCIAFALRVRLVALLVCSLVVSGRVVVGVCCVGFAWLYCLMMFVLLVLSVTWVVVYGLFAFGLAFV